MKTEIASFTAATFITTALLSSAANATSDAEKMAQAMCQNYPVSESKLNSNMTTHLLIAYDAHKSGAMNEVFLKEIVGPSAARYIMHLDLGSNAGGFTNFLRTKGYTTEDAIARSKAVKDQGSSQNEFGFENINCPIFYFDSPENKAAAEFKALVNEYLSQQ
ncbi:hypothetical protein [Ectopseudomonas mendocina]|uniref:hypothetical protein n=1 Tax=Ectopseudomonas mendocina TaxID=300 RepID=UPI003F014CE3